MTTPGHSGDVLALRVECLDPKEASPLDIAAIGAPMLWPSDETARGRALHAFAVDFMRRNRDWQDGELGFDPFDFAAAATPLPEMSRAAENPFVYGFIAGSVLLETVSKIGLRLEDASIGTSIETVSNRFWPKWRVLPKTINNKVWPEYKCVSHFWAAYIFDTIKREDTVFPCHYTKIADFLSIAEAFRDFGETLRAHKAPQPILPVGGAMRLPFEVTKAKIAFQTFSPIEERRHRAALIRDKMKASGLID